MQKLLGKPSRPARVSVDYPGVQLTILLKDSLDLEILNLHIAATQRRQLQDTFKRIR